MFTYPENLERLERLESRMRDLDHSRSRWSDAEAEEYSQLYADAGEIRAWLDAVNRAEG
jgi:hypothetical protein